MVEREAQPPTLVPGQVLVTLNYACGHDCYRSQQHRTVALGPRKACHNTYEKAINSCGGVDIVLESSSAEYRHSRQFSHFPVYPGLYPQRPIEAIELPAKSYLAPLFSYIAPLMSSEARRRRPVALYHSLPPLPCPQPTPPPPQQRRRSRRRLGRLGCMSSAVKRRGRCRRRRSSGSSWFPRRK